MTLQPKSLITLAVTAGLALAGACKNDNPRLAPDSKQQLDAKRQLDASTIDAPPAAAYLQVEQLARPGVNEALLLTNTYLNDYNASAPAFTGVPMATISAIDGEAENTLEALYLGMCLFDGLDGLTAGSGGTGLKPAGQPCPAVGGGIFTTNNRTGVTLTAAAGSAASAYATLVFSQFQPDVMRIDTTQTSGYGVQCGSGSGSAVPPLFCGGRQLTDDVIDITYDYLLAGGTVTQSSTAQLIALVSDGVVYNDSVGGAAGLANNPTSLSTPVPANTQQGHPPVGSAFPFSAPPF